MAELSDTMDVRKYKARQDKDWKNKGGNESGRNRKERSITNQESGNVYLFQNTLDPTSLIAYTTVGRFADPEKGYPSLFSQIESRLEA